MHNNLIIFLFICIVVAGVIYKWQQPYLAVKSENLFFQRIDATQHILQQIKGKPFFITLRSQDCQICLQEIDQKTKQLIG